MIALWSLAVANRLPLSAMARLKGCGVRMPATTSSPWALTRNSP